MNAKRIIISILTLFTISFNFYSNPFNSKLQENELEILNKGEVLIKNINNMKNMCLDKSSSDLSTKLYEILDELSPNYLAEVIQIKPIEGNEDLPNKLKALLNNVSEYAGIPYYSERNKRYYDLYSSATIKEKHVTESGQEIIFADLVMQPFGTVNEILELYQIDNCLLYTATNTNKLRYHDKFDCVKAGNMKMCILLFKHENNWILYGIGGVDAWRVPFFTERIETSFINRIKTFCEFIFKQF